MLNMRQAFETTAIETADKLTIAGSASTVVGWITSSDFGVLAGILIGVVGLLINWYFKHRQDKRAESSHRAYMERLKTHEGSTVIAEWKQEVDE